MLKENEKTEVLYISTNPSNAEFQRIRRAIRPGIEEVTYGMPEASHKFHSAFAEGFAANSCNVCCLSPRPISHKFHKGVVWRGSRDRSAGGVAIYHPWLINLPGVKQLFHGIQVALFVLRWEQRTREARDRLIVFDAAYVTGYPFALIPAVRAKVKTASFFADIYSYMAPVEDASSRKVGVSARIARRLVKWCIERTTGLVVITEAISEVVNPGDKPFVVVEGLASEEAEASFDSEVEKSAYPTVLYAGALRKEYGLEDLIDGFTRCMNPDFRLVIYGAGDYADEIYRRANSDPRIDFRGRAPLAEVLEAERQAWLVVNPRPTTRAFTKYSFPSKNMEYLQSGTALLATRLPGIPAEYYDYFYPVEGSGGAEALSRGITKCLNLGVEELSTVGARARNFVLAHKSGKRQAARVLEMMFGRGFYSSNVG